MPEIAQLIEPHLSSYCAFGNPGSLHRLGVSAMESFSNSRRRVASVLGAQPEEIIFTSGGTESINFAIRGYLEANPRKGKHVISTRTEHKATLAVLDYLSNHGHEVTYIGVDSAGEPNWLEVESAIRPDTALLTFTHVNNETGAILPVSKLVDIRNRINRSAVIHLDCVQSLGKLPLRPSKDGVELVSMSGHKIHAVKGVGAIYIKSGIRMQPLIIGGGQQGGLRSGTESTFLAEAFALALEKSYEQSDAAYLKLTHIHNDVSSVIQSFGGVILSPEDGSKYILNAALPMFEAETLLHALEEHDIFISTVSACASKNKKASHVLAAMGIDKSLSRSAVRISFSRFSQAEDIEQINKALGEAIKRYAL